MSNDNYEVKMRHLEMIQAVINRMANNSFMLKGWAVILVAGIFALSDNDANKIFFLVAYIPIVLFWFLDSYFWKEIGLGLRFILSDGERQKLNIVISDRNSPGNRFAIQLILSKEGLL